MDITAIIGFLLFETLGGLVLWLVISKKGANRGLSPFWAFLGVFGIAMVLLPIVSLLSGSN